MGYDVHITRREDWSDPEGPDITTAEFENAVVQDLDLVMVPMPEGWQRGQQWVAELASDTALRQESGPPWYNGRIVSKKPSKLVIVWMCRLATALGARVQGDDGEFYTEDGQAAQPA